jgi:O-antigen ligase
VIPILIAVSCVGVFLVLASDDIKSMLRIRTDATLTVTALNYRQRMWYGATELVKQSPLVGHGLGTYPVLQQQLTGYGRTGEKVLATNPSIGEMAHSFWLQTAAEQGILGVCAFASILVMFVVSAARRLFFLDPGVRRSLLLATLAAISGFAVDAIANPAWQFSQANMYVWLMLGLGVAALRPRK